jgi:hypothetical protein
VAETIEQYKQRIARSGGFGRAKAMTKKERHDSASRASRARWEKTKKLVEEIREGSKALERKNQVRSSRQKKEKP